MSSIKEDLETALQTIETEGWWNGKKGLSSTCGECLLTALPDDGRLETACSFLDTLLPTEYRKGHPSTNLIAFNDGNSEEDVKDLLRVGITLAETEGV